MDIIHYIIVIPIILLIIFYQLRIFRRAVKKINTFKDIFPSNKLAYSVNQVSITIGESSEKSVFDGDNASGKIWNDDMPEEGISFTREVEVSQISINSTNPTVTNIKDAINMYLQKNKGAASDFSLMKDVVERYCGAEEEEISIMQPIPLYMGLMGTMVGIIVGISVIAFNGGVDNLTNVSSMMICVAIAMAASFVGILCTTIISWKSKGAKTQIETNKNLFYSWLQTELLPVLSGNSVTALSLLQTNLMTFNQTFQGNIKEFDNVLTSVRQVSKDQAYALDAISKINIKDVAKANVVVLNELQKCTGQIGQFTQYLTNVNNYLNAVNSLNENLNNHLDRTAAIENMGAFFEKEMTQVQSREEYIKQVVGSVDSSLEKTFKQITESLGQYMETLKNQATTEAGMFKETYENQQKEFVEKLKEQQDAISQRAADMEEILKRMQDMPEMRGSIKSLADTSRENSKRLDQIVDLIESGAYNIGDGTVRLSSSAQLPISKRKASGKWMNILNISIKIIALLAFVMFAYEFVVKYIIG